MNEFGYRNLPLLLLKTREASMACFRPILHKYELTEQQWRILRVIWAQGPQEPRELCQKCCILSPSMAGILKRMVELKLVEKHPLDDQRRISIDLAPDVDKQVEVILAEHKKIYKQLEEKIGVEELAQLYLQLEKVIKALQ